MEEGGSASGSSGGQGEGGVNVKEKEKGRCILSIKSEEGRKYYMARGTVLEMLQDRGYLVSQLQHGSESDFLWAYRQNPSLQSLRIRVSHRSDTSKQILVIFCGTDGEIRKATMAGILDGIDEKESLHRVMLILQSKMNHHAQKLADDYPVKVETFHITELLGNVTKHVLNDQKYKVLTDEEKQELLQKYRIEDKQLPKMLKNDAIARHFGLEEGQVVQVTYKNDGIGGVTNRVVI